MASPSNSIVEPSEGAAEASDCAGAELAAADALTEAVFLPEPQPTSAKHADSAQAATIAKYCFFMISSHSAAFVGGTNRCENETGGA